MKRCEAFQPTQKHNIKVKKTLKVWYLSHINSSSGPGWVDQVGFGRLLSEKNLLWDVELEKVLEGFVGWGAAEF